jgi:redox-sensitive bicupin YhaK (pirin superfamily)
MNEHEQRCRFLQVWMTPDRRGHTPQYGSSAYAPADRHNQLLHVLSGVGPAPAWQRVNSKGAIQLHADANVFVSENDAGVSYQLELGPSRQAYLVCMEGEESLLLKPQPDNSVDLTTDV